jgi:hypothetical protein
MEMDERDQAAAPAVLGNVNLLIHGLIFIRPNQGNVELIAPRLAPHTVKHHFLGGVRGNLNELLGDVDWTQIGLAGPQAPTLPPGQMPKNLKNTIPQFSLSGLDLGDWNPQYFLGRIIVPWPVNFFSVRCDYFGRAFQHNGLRVGREIEQRCTGGNVNAEICLCTCLQYQYTKPLTIPGWNAGTNLHCYFEPCIVHTIDDVNEDLIQAQNLFTKPQHFDLQMRHSAGSIVTRRGSSCPDPAPDVAQDDDYSLTEDPKAKDICTTGAAALNEHIVNVSPANCPNFFVGP